MSAKIVLVRNCEKIGDDMMLELGKNQRSVKIYKAWWDHRFQELFDRFLTEHPGLQYVAFSWQSFIISQWFIGNHMSKRLLEKTSVIIVLERMRVKSLRYGQKLNMKNYMTTVKTEYRKLFCEWSVLKAEIDASGQGLKHPKYGRYKNIKRRLAQLYPIVGDEFDEQCAQKIGLRGDNGKLSMVQEEKPVATCGGVREPGAGVGD